MEAISGSLEVLSELDRAISRKRAGTVRWMIGALRYESPATVTLRAVPLSEEVDVSAEVAQSYLGGLKVLQEGKGLPEIFSEAALNAVKRLGRIGDGIKTIKIQHKREIVRITERLAVNVEELVSRTFESAGSVEGKLEMVTIHSQRYFRLVHGAWLCFLNKSSRLKQLHDHNLVPVRTRARTSQSENALASSLKSACSLSVNGPIW